MASPFFRKITLLAVVLIALLLGANYYFLTGYAQRHSGAAVAIDVRVWVLAVTLVVSASAIVIGSLISRSLRMRVARLKRVAEGLLVEASESPRSSDPEDDLASLERSLNAVSGELRALVDRLRLESSRRETIL